MKYQLICFWAPLGPNLVRTGSFKTNEKSTFLRFGPHLVPSDPHSVPLGPYLVPIGRYMVPTWSHLVRTWSPRRVKKPIKTNEISTFLLLGPTWSQRGPQFFHVKSMKNNICAFWSPLGPTWPSHGLHLVPFGPHFSPRRA